MVNRGWIPAAGDRTVLPDIRVGSGIRDVTARIEAFPEPAIRLERTLSPPGAAWPRRLLFPTGPELSAELGIPLRGYQLLLDPAAADGYVRDWEPGGMPAERHVAYAVQWLGLALTVVAIYVVLVIRNRGPAS
jgi:surfeit locus 1 family protein